MVSTISVSPKTLLQPPVIVQSITHPRQSPCNLPLPTLWSFLDCPDLWQLGGSTRAVTGLISDLMGRFYLLGMVFTGVLSLCEGRFPKKLFHDFMIDRDGLWLGKWLGCGHYSIVEVFLHRVGHHVHDSRPAICTFYITIFLVLFT